MGLLSFFSVLHARKLLIAQSIGVAALVALVVGLVIPKEFESSAEVQVDSLQQNLLTGLFEPRVRVSEFLGQQAAVARSRNVALQVYDSLVEEGYFLHADFEAEWRKETDGELVAGNDARLWAADQLLKKLDVSADGIESTLSISFRSDDPAQAARIANAFANAYMQTVLDHRQRRAARNAAKFSDETRTLEGNLDIAEQELMRLREESGLVGFGSERLEAAELDLAAITMRLAEARADSSEAQSLLRLASEARGDALLTLPLPQDVQSGRQAQSRLGAVRVQVQRLSERYGQRYPALMEARKEQRSLENTIMNAVADRAEYTLRRVEALETSLAEKKSEVLALQETKQRYSVLEKKVEASRQTYDLVANRSLQEALQSRVDTVDVLLLARAVPAYEPATPPLALVVALGLLAGFILGAMGAVAIEFIEGPVRRAEEAGRILRTRILSEISVPAPIAARGGL